MTYHLDSHGTTDIKLGMLSGVQTGNGIKHVEYDLRGIVHAYRKDDFFSAKTTIVKLYICLNSCPQKKLYPPPEKK